MTDITKQGLKFKIGDTHSPFAVMLTNLILGSKPDKFITANDIVKNNLKFNAPSYLKNKGFSIDSIFLKDMRFCDDVLVDADATIKLIYNGEYLQNL